MEKGHAYKHWDGSSFQKRARSKHNPLCAMCRKAKNLGREKEDVRMGNVGYVAPVMCMNLCDKHVDRLFALIGEPASNDDIITQPGGKTPLPDSDDLL